MAEVKLGKSLDQIIEENKKQISRGSKPKGRGGSRGDKRGSAPPPKGIRVSGGSKPRGGFALKGARGKVQQKQQPVDYDPMEDDEYGAPAPRRGGGAPLGIQRGGISKGQGRRGRGGLRGGAAPPQGDVDSKWQHDLYADEDFGPPRRMPQASSASAGTRLNISNLDYRVTTNDIRELFEVCGPILKAAVHFDKSERSEGTAHVVFQNRGDAQKALEQYNNVALDGKKLMIELAPAGAAPGTLSSGIRVERLSGGPAPRGGAGGAGRAFQSSLREALPRGGGGGGRGGGAGRGGRGGRGGRLRSGVERSQADLDAEMDQYMQE